MRTSTGQPYIDPDLWSGVALSIGAGLGAALGVVIAGGPGIAVGTAMGAGLGVVVGAVAQNINKARTQRG